MLPSLEAHAQTATTDATVVERGLTLYASGALGTPVRMNQKKDLEFLVDTGATLTGIWNSAVQQNELRHNHIGNANIGAADGMVVLRMLRFEGLNVGALTLDPPILTEFPDYFAYYRRPLSGILGADFLKDYLVVFDFPRQKIVFYPKNINLTRKMPGYFDVVPLKYSEPYAALRMKVKVNGKDVNALLDTGASMTTVLVSEARRIGLPVEGAPDSSMSGINGNAIPAWFLDVQSIKAGTREWKDTNLVASQFKVDEADGFAMLFGINHLGETPFAVDYGRNRLLLAKPEKVQIAEAEKRAAGALSALPQEEGFPCAFPAMALEGLVCIDD